MIKQARIVMTGPGRGEVFLDGVKVEGVKKVTFTGEVNCMNELQLVVHAGQVEFEGPVDVSTIGSEAREYHTPHLPEPMPKHPPGTLVDVSGEDQQNLMQRMANGIDKIVRAITLQASSSERARRPGSGMPPYRNPPPPDME